MNAQKLIRNSSKIYIVFSMLSLLYVSLLSLFSPQATMDLVSTPLPNTDALSSIRGVYGGVGLVICFTLLYLLKTDLKKGLLFLLLFWTSYAFSRIITALVDGPLGDFGAQWLKIESIFGFLALLLLILFNNTHEKTHEISSAY